MKLFFYPFVVSVNRCGVTCKIIDGSYAMLGVKKTSVDKMEMYAIHSKNGIIMNVGASVEN